MSIKDITEINADVLREMLLARAEQARAKLDSKDGIREAHRHFVLAERRAKANAIRRDVARFGEKLFASGSDIRPECIQPILVPVNEDPRLQCAFRLARYYWSLPYSKGYGRRLRFLVIDNHNGKLIGIIGLQSPPIELAPRDRLFNFESREAKEIAINKTMDAFTVGAVPPYSFLLGGKLVALSLISNEIREAYAARYANAITKMEGRNIGGDLVAITTTSAFGRSSIYNRLVYRGRLVAKSLGMTTGFGNFHLNDLVKVARQWLKDQYGNEIKTGFGSGPRAIWRDIAKVCNKLGIPANQVLNHGIKREVFLFSLTKNLADVMSTGAKPDYYDVPFRDVADWWANRWLRRRAETNHDWRTWTREQTIAAIKEGLDVL